MSAWLRITLSWVSPALARTYPSSLPTCLCSQAIAAWSWSRINHALHLMAVTQIRNVRHGRPAVQRAEAHRGQDRQGSAAVASSGGSPTWCTGSSFLTGAAQSRRADLYCPALTRSTSISLATRSRPAAPPSAPHSARHRMVHRA